MRPILMCFIVLFLLSVPTTSVFADEIAIAVLDFELKDLTRTPITDDELERTASIKPLLNETLSRKYSYQIAEVNSESKKNADASVGYLFDHHNVAARLGQDVGAEWVIVGRVHKASFLFVYFMVHVINAKTEQLVGDLIVEVKGPQRKLTIKGVEKLADQIVETIQRRG